MPPPRSLALRRRFRRARRSALAWWVCACAVGIAGADRLADAEAELAAQRRAWGHDAPVVVAQQDLPAGHRLRAGDLRTDRWPLAAVPSGALPGAEGAAVVGRVLAAGVVAGEAVVEARLAPNGVSPTAALVPPGHRAVALPAHGAASGSGLAVPPLRPGDRVDVLAAAAPPVLGAPPGGVVVVAAALVVEVTESTVTIAVPSAEAAAVAGAAASSPLALALVGGEG